MFTKSEMRLMLNGLYLFSVLRHTLCVTFRCISLKPRSALKKMMKCPTTEQSWKRRSVQVKCSSDEFYHCMRTDSKELLEICSRGVAIYRAGHCPYVETINLQIQISATLQPCDTRPGCPTTEDVPFQTYELFKYPACLETKISLTALMSTLEKYSFFGRTTTKNEKSSADSNKLSTFEMNTSTATGTHVTTRKFVTPSSKRGIEQDFSNLLWIFGGLALVVVCIIQLAIVRLCRSIKRNQQLIHQLEHEEGIQNDHYSEIREVVDIPRNESSSSEDYVADISSVDIYETNDLYEEVTS